MVFDSMWRCVAVLGLLGPVACGGGDSNECINFGVADCPCTLQGGCLVGLQCIAGTCIGPGSGPTSMPTSGEPGSTGGPTGSDPGTTSRPPTTGPTESTATSTGTTDDASIGNVTVTTATTATSEPAGVCGDGEVDPGEACDDGNQTDDDACSNTCQPPSGPVLEFENVMPTVILGTKAGTSFSDMCPGVLRGWGGYQAYDDYYSQVRGKCADAALVPSGDGYALQLTQGLEMPAHGGFANTPVDTSCSGNRVIIGFRGTQGEDGDLNGIQTYCAPLSVDRNTLAVKIGDLGVLSQIGGVGLPIGDALCPANFVAIGILGFVDPQKDALVALGLHCARPVVKQ